MTSAHLRCQYAGRHINHPHSTKCKYLRKSGIEIGNLGPEEGLPKRFMPVAANGSGIGHTSS